MDGTNERRKGVMDGRTNERKKERKNGAAIIEGHVTMDRYSCVSLIIFIVGLQRNPTAVSSSVIADGGRSSCSLVIIVVVVIIVYVIIDSIITIIIFVIIVVIVIIIIIVVVVVVVVIIITDVSFLCISSSEDLILPLHSGRLQKSPSSCEWDS